MMACLESISCHVSRTAARGRADPAGLAAAVLLVAALVLSGAGQAHAQTYHVYVDELPDWAGYASNVMYEATRYWQGIHPGTEFYLADDPRLADFRVQWVKEFGGEHVGYAYGDKFVEVGLGDSNCVRDRWQPYSPGYVTDIMKHEIGHILGYGHNNDDPSDIMYPIAVNTEYGIVEQTLSFTENYARFIPVCTTRDVSSFSFDIESGDPASGFDAYFVPSAGSFERFVAGEEFEYNHNPGCHGKDYARFGDTCSGVPQRGGLIIHTGQLSESLVEITVRMQEIRGAGPGAPASVAPPGDAGLQDGILHGAGTAMMDGTSYVIRPYENTIVKIYGQITEPQTGDRVSITYTYPDGTTDGNVLHMTKDGHYETFMILGGESLPGRYEVLVSVKGAIVGVLEFDAAYEGEPAADADPHAAGAPGPAGAGAPGPDPADRPDMVLPPVQDTPAVPDTPVPDAMLIGTDEQQYGPGDTVTVTVSAGGAGITVDVTDPDGRSVTSGLLDPDADGSFVFTLPDSPKAGTYTVDTAATYSGKRITNSTSFVVPEVKTGIASLQPVDEAGGAASSFARGQTGFVRITLDSDPQDGMLVAAGLLDLELASVAVGSYDVPPGSGREIVLALFVPHDAAPGTADVHANVYSDWPSRGGVPLAAESSVRVGIR